ncbi:hypothetical protein GN244_ATG11716 [Phytophthora infestans]|uniref:Uncharacterized protein n=1 Tax=Phytophthora infestans TaxID=4787 RepID=A0A833T3K1_PHYIN|nr:hypothetical protein GN244_ATG11716 [Phytophthora infestans]KAF4128466.1 hypothetical protein GN958_ATG22386 [Phytophthora infestans]
MVMESSDPNSSTASTPALCSVNRVCTAGQHDTSDETLERYFTQDLGRLSCKVEGEAVKHDGTYEQHKDQSSLKSMDCLAKLMINDYELAISMALDHEEILTAGSTSEMSHRGVVEQQKEV